MTHQLPMIICEFVNSSLEKRAHMSKRKKTDDEALVSSQAQEALDKFYQQYPQLATKPVPYTTGAGLSDGFSEKDAWIQTYSGRRFCPTNPNPEAIVIQDIAHALSMQCRFSGHTSYFYSVAQHSVGVSYLCDEQDALWGLLHDASEAYLVDIPNPLKRSGQFDPYLKFENQMMSAVCKRFGLSESEPDSVRRADKMMLNIEANQLMSPLREDWVHPKQQSLFKIDPLSPQDAKKLFLERFFELAVRSGA